MSNRRKFIIESGASRFTAKAFADGMTSGLGHNPTIAIREFSGEREFALESLEAVTLNLTIRSNSLRVQDEMRYDDRRMVERVMNEEVLLTSKYPEILYRSDDIKTTKVSESMYKTEIRGRLTLNGVTRKQEVGAQVAIGPYSLRTNGNFEIRQSDFGIRKINVAGGSLTS
jgi:polyisoprenoid-binding protein YceI